MMKLFRRHDDEVVRHDHFIQVGVADWEQRVSEALSSQNAWKWTAWLALGVLGLSVAGNIYQSGQTKLQVVHVIHDSVGGVIAVSASSDRPGGPTQLMLKKAMEDWITHVRTVGIDILAMRENITAAFALIGSRAANIQLTDFLKSQGDEGPETRSQHETVSVDSVVAVPPTAATIGDGGMQTWSITWMETVTARDGGILSRTHWAANITFKLDPPGTVPSVEAATRNPDGIRIIAFSWTGGTK